MEENIYELKQENEEAAYESLCRRCGVCCGSRDNDPCVHLVAQADGTFICGTYTNRFGLRKTVTGKEFTCVMIRDVLKFGVRYDGCGYNA